MVGIDTLISDFLESVYPRYCKLSDFIRPDRLVLKIKQKLVSSTLEEMHEKGLSGSLDEFLDVCGGCATCAMSAGAQGTRKNVIRIFSGPDAI